MTLEEKVGERMSLRRKGGKGMPGSGNSKHFDFAGELVMFANR